MMRDILPTLIATAEPFVSKFDQTMHRINYQILRFEISNIFVTYIIFQNFEPLQRLAGVNKLEISPVNDGSLGSTIRLPEPLLKSILFNSTQTILGF